MTYVSITDYTNLVEENRALKQQIITLTENADSLRQEAIKKLEIQNINLEKLTQLESDMILTKSRLRSLEESRLLEKIILSIQDINNIDKLHHIYPYLNDLPILKNNGPNYIRNNDSIYVVHYKKGLLLDILKTYKSGDNIYDELSIYDLSLVTHMIAHLSKLKNPDLWTLSEREKILANLWWKY